MVKSCNASNGKQSDNFVQKSRKHHRRLNDKRGDFIGHGETFFSNVAKRTRAAGRNKTWLNLQIFHG